MRRVLIIFGRVVLFFAAGLGVLYVAFVRPSRQYWATVEAGELMEYHLRALLDDPGSPAWLKDRCGSDICLLDEGAIMELASIGSSEQRAGREHWAGVIIKSHDA